MSVTFGFYDSIGDDRVYDAEQFGSIFDGVIEDGIYERYGNAFRVELVSGMTIRVKSGRAWFNHTWTLNDGNYNIDLPAGSTIEDRTDTVCIVVDKASRTNYIDVLHGTPSSGKTPVAITNPDANQVYRYPLAKIVVRKYATSIQAVDITSTRGTDDPFYGNLTPFIVTPTRQWDNTFLTETNKELLSQLEASGTDARNALNQTLQDFIDEYDAWRENIEDVFADDGANAAIAMQAEIDKINYQIINNKYCFTELVNEDDENIEAYPPIVINGRSYYFDISDYTSYATTESLASVANDLSSIFKMARHTATYDIAANGTTTLHKGDFTPEVSMEGYLPMALPTISSGNNNVVPVVFNAYASSTAGFIQLRNISSTALTDRTCTIRVLYIKSTAFAST